MSTDLVFLRDAYDRSVRTEVTHADGVRVALDRTVFYPTAICRRPAPWSRVRSSGTVATG